MKKIKPLLTYISRNTTTCTGCGLCSKSCPQEIDVAGMDKVAHIDCNLCGDCLYVCPEKDTLQINKRNMKWLPGIVLGVLIIAGLLMGSAYELPTINLKWGSEEQIANAGLFTKDGLKNIKCFGSSSSFANNLREVEGIYGVSTYVGTHTVKVLYDKSMYNDTTLQELIFIPQKKLVSEIEPWIDSVAVFSLTVDNFFDPYDANYLQYLLRQNTTAYSYQSEFACPVIIKIFFPLGNEPKPEFLKDVIESEILTYQVGESLFKENLNYRVVTISEKPEIISRQDYIDNLLAE